MRFVQYRQIIAFLLLLGVSWIADAYELSHQNSPKVTPEQMAIPQGKLGVADLLTEINMPQGVKEKSIETSTTPTIDNLKPKLISKNLSLTEPFWCGNRRVLVYEYGKGLVAIDIETGQRIVVSKKRDDFSAGCSPDGRWAVLEDKATESLGVEDFNVFDFKLNKSYKFASAPSTMGSDAVVGFSTDSKTLYLRGSGKQYQSPLTTELKLERIPSKRSHQLLFPDHSKLFYNGYPENKFYLEKNGMLKKLHYAEAENQELYQLADKDFFKTSLQNRFYFRADPADSEGKVNGKANQRIVMCNIVQELNLRCFWITDEKENVPRYDLRTQTNEIFYLDKASGWLKKMNADGYEAEALVIETKAEMIAISPDGHNAVLMESIVNTDKNSFLKIIHQLILIPI